jgi:hypothetical protein
MFIVVLNSEIPLCTYDMLTRLCPDVKNKRFSSSAEALLQVQVNLGWATFIFLLTVNFWLKKIVTDLLGGSKNCCAKHTLFWHLVLSTGNITHPRF